jgi:hypothetical protein
MIHFNPELIEYCGDGHENDPHIGIIYRDIHCQYEQYIFQPIKRIFWRFYIDSGREFYTWRKCLEKKR